MPRDKESLECPDEVYTFLNQLRRDGQVNMFGAAPVVSEMFAVDLRVGRRWVSDWMRRFNPEKDS